jgi:type I restriction enzyme, S subunit
VNVLVNSGREEFQFTTVGEICDRFDGEVQTGPFGSQLHASDYSDQGIPVVMPQDMVDGRISCVDIARVDETHARRLSQHRLRIGDIVFSRRGDVSRFAVVTEHDAGWLCGTGSIRIRLNCPEIDLGYLRHFLKRDEVGVGFFITQKA